MALRQSVLYLLLIFMSHYAHAFDVDVDVCVIGAGPAGVQAAYTAEAEGLSVAIFEKNANVGGKTKAVFAGGSSTPYMMGAALHDASKSNSLLSLFNEFNIKETGSFPPRAYF